MKLILMIRILGFSYLTFSYIQYLENPVYLIKYNKIQIMFYDL